MFMLKTKKNSRNPFYYHELCTVIYCAFMMFLSLALVSYNPTDSSVLYYRSDGRIIANWCGWLGAHVAAVAWYFLGTAALWCIPTGFFFCYLFWYSIPWKEEWERIVGLVLGIITSATLLALHGILLRSMVAGGLIGQWCAYYSTWLLGDTVGVFLTWYTFLIAAIILITRLSLLNTVLIMVRSVQWLAETGIVQRIIKRMGQLLHGGVLLLYRILARMWDFFYSVLNGSIFSNTGLLVPAQRDSSCCDRLDIADLSVMSLDPLVDSGPRTSGQEHLRDESIFIDGLSELAKTEKSNLNDELLHEQLSDNKQPISLINDKELKPLVPGPKRVDGTKDTSGNDKAEKIVSYGVKVDYKLPDSTLLIPATAERQDAVKKKELEARAKTLEEKLERFGIYGSVVGIKSGPVVTLFEYEPAIDTKLSKIVALEDDLSLALQAMSIRILAPIPGRSVVGFEVANTDRKDVLFTTLFSAPEYQQGSAKLPLILGEDTVGGKVIADLARMPHLLIAGSTGSGKSVALNAMLISLVGKLSPAQMKLILIDPKRLEFAPYADIPHLLFPIVTQVQQVPSILRWVVKNMEQRYELMAHVGVRNITDYHAQKAAHNEWEPLPYIVVIIDELADLMMTVGRDVEDLITRITQMARAAGIHMMVATQRPSVDVITGLIKVNFPSRISFRVTSKVDSRTILDGGGAEKLLGRGDMLFLDSTAASLRRVHGAYISDAEIARVVNHLRLQQPVSYLNLQEELAALAPQSHEESDELYETIVEFVRTQEEVSISLLQRKFRIGYNRAARIIDQLAAQGMILPADNGKTRKVVR